MCFNFPQTRDNQWFEKVQCSEKIKGFLVILILLHINLFKSAYLSSTFYTPLIVFPLFSAHPLLTQETPESGGDHSTVFFGISPLILDQIGRLSDLFSITKNSQKKN